MAVFKCFLQWFVSKGELEWTRVKLFALSISISKLTKHRAHFFVHLRLYTWKCFVYTHIWKCSCSREFFRLSAGSASILCFHSGVAATSNLCVPRSDVASLPTRQGMLPSGATYSAAITFSRVINYHHGVIHPCQCVHTALACLG